MRTIFILADSTNRRFLDIYGSKRPAHTPSLDYLAKRGTVFENHWCGSAPCMPARRDIMTGRLNFLEKPWGAMEPFDQSLPYMLKQKNVYSHIVTDHYLYMHVGGEGYCNSFTSWDYVRGQEFDNLNLHPDKQGVPKEPVPEGYKGIYSLAHDENLKKIKDETQYPTPMTMQRAAGWLEENHDADQFLLWVEGFDPHEPFDVTQEYLDMYREEENDTYEGQPLYWPSYQENEFNEEEIRHLNASYKALLTMTDKYIGRILDVLDRHHMWEDTMVIFTTDHGYMLGEHGYMAKNYMPAYNEVFHIPLIIHYPGATAGRVNGPTQNIDIFPTIMEYYGISEKELHYPIHGKSLVPLLTEDKKKVREGVIYGYFGKSVNYTDGSYTYHRAAKDEENKPLYVYTAMPTTLRQTFGVDCIEESKYNRIMAGNFLKYTDYPVFKIPAEIIDYHNPSQCYEKRSRYNGETMLFDIETDYEQSKPVEDAGLHNFYKERLKYAMKEYQAPDEQFERLGL
jgi:arylsulfatase A-like enzyme